MVRHTTTTQQPPRWLDTQQQHKNTTTTTMVRHNNNTTNTMMVRHTTTTQQTPRWLDTQQQMKKPPPLHTGADWKVVLHLPEIEKWLKATSDRVTQLSHSVGQDGDNRHVDVHLVQLKDICEDISDHVEQIHALLETEFSLKLLSYSVNIIVDIRTVQLLWHQLRVSVLVLKERLLQGLQDSNGNFTRQTDILQAFSQDQHQTRLDALTEVDDCGQLTIRCSQDYFSLDCGITAFELSDYSPSDEPGTPGTQPRTRDEPGTQPRTRDEPGTQPRTRDAPQDLNQDLNQEPGVEESGSHLSNRDGSANQNHRVLPMMQCSSLSDSVKCPLQAASLSTEPSLPKRAALLLDSRGVSGEVSPVSGLQFQAELSRSTPSLMDPPDRSKFWLELDSVYPEHVSQSYESLQVCPPCLQIVSFNPSFISKQVMNGCNLRIHRVSCRHPEGSVQRLQPGQRSSSGAGPTAGAPPPLQDPKPEEGKPKEMESRRKETRSPSEDSDSSASPVREQPPSDLEASGEDSDPRPPPKTEVWILKRHKGIQLSRTSPDRQHWFGSEEFLALPAHLRKTEMLALKLESLTQSIPLVGSGSDSGSVCVNDSDPVHPTALVRLGSRFSPSSSSDAAPSLDGSIESGRLSELQSEEEEGQPTAPPVDGRGCSGLVQRLLEDIQSQDKEPDVWRKIEVKYDSYHLKPECSRTGSPAAA
uniref:A-kinase anchor protein 6 n=1 Tax=Amphiprion ocellaris TaxID=80972 RepID=A0A3Q1BEA7_AMPOC